MQDNHLEHLYYQLVGRPEYRAFFSFWRDPLKAIAFFRRQGRGQDRILLSQPSFSSLIVLHVAVTPLLPHAGKAEIKLLDILVVS